MATLFVGNLKWECTDEELFNLFSGGGFIPTNANIVMGRNGRSRGYGLVTFADASVSDSAMGVFNEQEFQGRNLIVHEDRGATRGAGKTDDTPDPNFTGTSVFVNNLSWSCSEEELKGFFASHGSVSATIALRKDGKSRGWGTVQFTTPEQAEAALSMKGQEFGGRMIECLIDKKA
jgi:RNA recognition motif-containing protein